MKTRLVIFSITLLLLPFAGFWLSDSKLLAFPADTPPSIANPQATLFTTLILFGYILLVNQITKLISGNRPFTEHRSYIYWTGLAGALLVWLLTYLNLFVSSWTTQTENPVMQILLYTPLFATLVPAILSTRALLGSIPNLIKHLSRVITLPRPGNESLAAGLLAIAAVGLLGGAAWPVQLFWLMWPAPLLLLNALQLLWHESTIFDGLESGNWTRVLFAAISGIIVSNLAIEVYIINGGFLEVNVKNPLLVQSGYALFGLLCLQLSDVISESWRGKKKGSMFRQKKKFPIPVVVRKD